VEVSKASTDEAYECAVPDRVEVLIVCTANRYRSPIAEHLLRSAAASHGLNWLVRSCGLRAKDGEPLDRIVTTLLHKQGIDVTGWTSRHVSREFVQQADVVLAVDESQRSALAERFPETIPRTFLLRQFARYMAKLPDLQLEYDLCSAPGLLAAVREARTHVQPVPTNQDEVADPAGRSARMVRASAARIAHAIDIIAESASVARRHASERAPS
jgi:protein-tyrosine phosphatase